MAEVRPIDANALIESIEAKGKEYGVTVANRCTFRDIAKLAPTLDCAPVRHGEWLKKKHKLFGNTYENVCSECKCDLALA